MKPSFTLVELIVVVVIIAVLAAAVIPNAFRVIEKAKIVKLVSERNALKTAIFSLYIDTGLWSGDESGFGNGIVNSVSIVLNQVCASTFCGPGSSIQKSSLYENDYAWPGWNGPYLESFMDRHPWKGYVHAIRTTPSFSYRKPGLWIMYRKYSASSSSSAEFGIPEKAAARIDRDYDDGDLGEDEGDFFLSGSGILTSYMWRTIEDTGGN